MHSTLSLHDALRSHRQQQDQQARGDNDDHRAQKERTEDTVQDGLVLLERGAEIGRGHACTPLCPYTTLFDLTASNRTNRPEATTTTTERKKNGPKPRSRMVWYCSNVGLRSEEDTHALHSVPTRRSSISPPATGPTGPRRQRRPPSAKRTDRSHGPGWSGTARTWG